MDELKDIYNVSGSASVDSELTAEELYKKYWHVKNPTGVVLNKPNYFEVQTANQLDRMESKLDKLLAMMEVKHED